MQNTQRHLQQNTSASQLLQLKPWVPPHISVSAYVALYEYQKHPRVKWNYFQPSATGESQQVGRKPLRCLTAQCTSAHILVLVPPNNTFIWRILAFDTYKWINSIFWGHIKMERNEEAGMFDSLSISYLNAQSGQLPGYRLFLSSLVWIALQKEGFASFHSHSTAYYVVHPSVYKRRNVWF